MAAIQLTTFIAAPPQVVFDLSRSISLHKRSMEQSKEQAVGGRTSGLMELGETVTWQAKHFFKERRLTVRMKALEKHQSFTDEALPGNDFKHLEHKHYFKPCENGTIMIDHFDYELKWGRLGKAASAIFVTPYLQKLLQKRNAFIKQAAEGKGWKQYLS